MAKHLKENKDENKSVRLNGSPCCKAANQKPSAASLSRTIPKLHWEAWVTHEARKVP
ncbi:hypothetical protein M408DRAFT_333949 [Serendipita vermifera MAFF 305830]|uniref:Uncharacterized protein n=1 Tax=Serendipita vermifera MAFF 305830 TaxID=933852 RepID=A0A0C3A779_SERVB|nr:hypothetical protein M408DRAFT_333949 [Serendipita vermifera MAFF 305830]